MATPTTTTTTRAAAASTSQVPHYNVQMLQDESLPRHDPKTVVGDDSIALESLGEGRSRPESLGEGRSRPESQINDSTELLVSDLEPIDGGAGAYKFLAAAALFEFVIWGQSYAYGAYEAYHNHNPSSPLYGKASQPALSAIGTLVIAGQHFVPLLSRGFFRTYPHWIKRTAFASIALSSACLLIASFLDSYVPALLIFQGILYGTLSGVTFTPVILWLPQWFDTRMGFASGIIYSGSGAGGTLFPIAIGHALESVGFAWTLRLSAAWGLILAGGAAFFLKPRLPIARPTALPPRSWTRALAPEGLGTLLHPFAATQIGLVVCQAAAWCTISLYLATWTSSLGFSPTTSTGVLSGFNAAATVGYLVTGRLIDSMPYLVLMSSSALICALSAWLLLGFSHSLPLIIIFSLAFGAAGGGFPTFYTPVSRSIAALRSQEVSPIYLAVIFVRGIAAVAGPLIGSALYDPTVSDWSLYGTKGFKGLVLFVGSGMALASAAAVVGILQQKRRLFGGSRPSKAGNANGGGGGRDEMPGGSGVTAAAPSSSSSSTANNRRKSGEAA